MLVYQASHTQKQGFGYLGFQKFHIHPLIPTRAQFLKGQSMLSPLTSRLETNLLPLTGPRLGLTNPNSRKWV